MAQLSSVQKVTLSPIPSAGRGILLVSLGSSRFTKASCDLLFDHAASSHITSVDCILLDSLEVLNLQSLFSFDSDEARDIVSERTIRLCAMFRAANGPVRQSVEPVSAVVGMLPTYASRLASVSAACGKDSSLARLIQNQTFKNLHPLLKRLGVTNSRSAVVGDLARYLIEELALRLAAADTGRWECELSLTEAGSEVDDAVARAVSDVRPAIWMPIVRVQPVHSSGMQAVNLNYTYAKDDASAVTDCSFQCGPGEIVGILGRSGSGKSTLLKLVAGHLAPASGSIRIGDTDAALLRPHQRSVATVFQDFALFPHLTVRQNVSFALEADERYSMEDISTLVDILLRRFHLVEQAGQVPSRLSGGQRQRTAIARALASGPSLLLLDEPTASLDFDAKDELAQILWHVASLPPAPSIVLVSHDREFVLDVASTLAVMHKGRIIGFGPATRLARDPGSALVAAALGLHILLPAPPEQKLRGVQAVASTDGQSILLMIPEDDIVVRRIDSSELDAASYQGGIKGRVMAKIVTARGLRLVIQVGPSSVHCRLRGCDHVAGRIVPGNYIELSVQHEDCDNPLSETGEE